MKAAKSERFKSFVRYIMPPVIYELLKSIIVPNKKYGLHGNFDTWKEALLSSTGYDNDLILEKTKCALLKVKNSEAIYERDSVLFEKIEYSWPLLAGLMWGVAQNGGDLRVLDIGGSLGSTYFQNREFLKNINNVSWGIIEQENHVNIGREYFEDQRLKFFYNIEEGFSAINPNVIILSGVLQFFEKPYEMLDRIINKETGSIIIIDRTPFWDGEFDRLCVQNVPPSIYPASYPSWVFSKDIFYKYFQDFEFVADYESLDKLDAPFKCKYEGLILYRK